MTGINRNKRNIELCRQIRERDTEAETRMLLENDGLIIQMAMDIKARRGIVSSDGIDEDDLMQVGRIAMLNAARSFDESRNVRFSTFACETIRNALTDLCDSCQASYERHMTEKGQKHLFIDAGKETEDAINGQGCDVNHRDPAGNTAMLHVMLEKLGNRLMCLSERERKLLAYHYGLGSNEIKSLSEVAAYFTLTEKYIRTMENKALAKLKDMMNDGKVI